MIKKTLFLFLIFFLNHNALCNETQCIIDADREIAFTMDGLAIAKQKEILEILGKYEILGAFAINEGIALKNHSMERIAKNLEQYVAIGHIVFNHTYEHKDANIETFEEFKADVLRGEKLLNEVLEKGHIEQLKYFRFPFLSTGETDEKRIQIDDFLKKKVIQSCQ